MSEPINDAGPAFPQQAFIGPHGGIETASGYFSNMEGITIRDYFAAKALVGMISNGAHWDGQGDAEMYAKFAYAQADAMLEARK